jgi:hypothetical protein
MTPVIHCFFCFLLLAPKTSFLKFKRQTRYSRVTIKTTNWHDGNHPFGGGCGTSMVQPAVLIRDTEGGVWTMNFNALNAYSVVPGLKLICQDAPMDIPEAWACKKAFLSLLGFVIFEFPNVDHAWIFERVDA